MRFTGLIFSALLCFAGVYCTPVLADDTTEIPVTETEEDAEEEVIETDEKIDEIREQMDELLWCPDDDYVESNEDDSESEDGVNRGSDDERRQELCKKIKELRSNEAALIKNTQELEENYQNMKDKETSFENRMLGATGIGTVGIGGMMAATALAEQSADNNAEADMQAYLATFQCTVGDARYTGGTKNIELGGANQLIDLYRQYAELATDLKERKSALELSAGIESEVLIDKASSGLYDNVGNGIGAGAYASIARALQNPNGDDAHKWAAQKESTSSNLKTGALVAGVGAAATAVANYAINHNNKDKSAEILAQREEIKTSFDNLLKTLIDECNETIKKHKELAATLTADQLKDERLNQYKQDVDAAQPVSSVSELWGSMFCK